MSINERARGAKLIKIVRKVQLKTGEPITIKSLARRLGVRQTEALQLCEDNGLNVNVGFGIQGVGCAKYSSISEYSVEDLSAPYHGDLEGSDS